MDSINEMKKYLKDRSWGWSVFVVLFFGGMGILMLATGTSIPGGLVLVAFAGYFAYLFISSSRQNNRWWEEAQQNGLLEAMAEDFQSALPCFNGNLLLGERWAFGKGSGTCHAYKDMVRLFQHVRKRNFVEQNRTLWAVLQDGRNVTLCSLPLRKKGQQELGIVVSYMMSKNPNIQF